MPPPDAQDASTTTTTASTPATTTTASSTPPAPPAPRAAPARTPPAEKPAKAKTVPGVQVTFLGPKDPQNLSRGEVKVAGLNWKPDHPTRTVRRWRLVGTDGKPDEKAAAEIEQLDQGHTLGSVGAVPATHPKADQPAFRIEKVQLPAVDG